MTLRRVSLTSVTLATALLPAIVSGQEPSLNSPDNSPQHQSTTIESNKTVLDLQPVTLEDIPSDESSSTQSEPTSAVPDTDAQSDAVVQASAESIAECDGDLCDADACDATAKQTGVQFGDWIGYNPSQSNTTWMADGDFGMFSIESFPTLEYGEDSSWVFGTGFHFLNGPAGTAASSPDMPPRLFDLQLAYHSRNEFKNQSVLDVKLGFGIFTDFEGSARKGVRFPGHVVGYNQLTPTLSSVLGLEVLDRDDISVLPVGGFMWRPHPELLFELVFPRPSIQMKLDTDTAMYFAGELGGGTWAIQRDNTNNDNVTYRDLRVLWGIQDFDDDSDSTWELGWAFDRSLEYRSGQGDTDFGGAFLMRWHTRF